MADEHPAPVQHDERPPWAPAAVLFDRDGTLVQDVPYNGDPAAVRPMPGADTALAKLRAAGIPLGVISNQSGIGRGLITKEQVDAVNRRVEQLLGPFAVWQICPHASADGCACRKPAPGMILAAAARLGVLPQDVVVIGDIGADVEAAAAAGATSVLVPTAVTRGAEKACAPVMAHDLLEAADIVLGVHTAGRAGGGR
jgi:D-glycero-D-manno-heptose 1,7-bisphosphate phosphatase